MVLVIVRLDVTGQCPQGTVTGQCHGSTQLIAAILLPMLHTI